MDKKYSNFKWIGSAMVLLATAVGAYFFYVYSREKQRNEKRKEEQHEKCTPFFQEQRDMATDLRKHGNGLFIERQYENAIACYNEALLVCPLQYHQDKAKLYQNKAAALHNLHRLDEALVEANKALEFSPRYTTALIRRSKIHEAQGRLQQALFDMAAAVIFDSSERSDSINRMEHINKIIATHAIDEELTREPVLQSELDIRNYFQSFPNDPFVEQKQQWQQQLTSSDQMAVLDCIHLLQMGKYQESFRAVQKAFSSREWTEDIISVLHLLRGTFYLLSCREDLALDDFAAVIRNSHTKPLVKINAIIKRATVLLLHDDTLLVEKVFDEALEIDPTCPDIYYHRGLSFEIAKDKLAAINDYNRALDLHPGYSFAAVHKVFIDFLLSDESQPYKYLQEFKALINRFPQCIEVHVIFVKVLIEVRNTIEAERVSQSLRLLQPDSGLILLLVAEIKITQHKVLEAIEILTEAIKRDPRHGELYHFLAVIYIRSGELEDAIEHLDRAITHARNRKTMRIYIELREGILAQLNVSSTFDIPVKDVLQQMCPGAILSPDDE